MLATRKVWIGFGISALLLALFLATVDLGRMMAALKEADYLFLIPGISLYLVSVLFRTLRWQALLRHMRSIPVIRLYPIVVVGYMANNLLPMRLGELVRSYYVGERENVSKTSALVTIFIERVLDALILLFFIAVIALLVPVAGLAEAFGEKYGVAWPFLVVALSVPFVAVFGALVLFSLFPDSTRALALVVIRPMPRRIEAPLRHIIDMFLVGLMPLRNPHTLTYLFVMSVPIWLFEAGLFFFAGFAFGLQNVYDSLGEMVIVVILVTAVANIGSSIPAAPGGIGLFELVAMQTLVLLPLATVDRSVAAGFAAVVHLSLLLPMIILGQIFLWVGNISLRKLSRVGRSEQNREEAVSVVPSVEGDSQA